MFSKKYSRRDVLKGIGALGASMLLPYGNNSQAASQSANEQVDYAQVLYRLNESSPSPVGRIVVENGVAVDKQNGNTLTENATWGWLERYIQGNINPYFSLDSNATLFRVGQQQISGTPPSYIANPLDGLSPENPGGTDGTVDIYCTSDGKFGVNGDIPEELTDYDGDNLTPLGVKSLSDILRIGNTIFLFPNSSQSSRVDVDDHLLLIYDGELPPALVNARMLDYNIRRTKTTGIEEDQHEGTEFLDYCLGEPCPDEKGGNGEKPCPPPKELPR